MTHTPDQLTNFHNTITTMVRSDSPDLTARQLAVLLTCYLQDGPHTVRGLAAELNVSKSVVTRALDKLGEIGLTRRVPDPEDGRSVLVKQTLPGRAFIRELRCIVLDASAAMKPVRRASPTAAQIAA
jgi:DNA-binding MarR family transcriptional regulator